MADELNLSFYTVQSILIEDFNMSELSSKFILKFSLDEQKEPRHQVYQELLNQVKNDPDSLNKVIHLKHLI